MAAQTTPTDREASAAWGALVSHPEVTLAHRLTFPGGWHEMTDEVYSISHRRGSENDSASTRRLRRQSADEDDLLVAILAVMVRSSLLKKARDVSIQPPKAHADDPVEQL